MLLFLAFLLIHGCSGHDFTNAKDVTPGVVSLINSYRLSLVEGYISSWDEYLPSSQSMFQLKPSAVLNSTARLNVLNCNANSDNIPPGQSINIYTLKYSSEPANLTALLYFVVQMWEEELLLFGIDKNVVYTNTGLKEVTNMLYYKSTEAGCYYNLCNTTESKMQIIACVFNMSPQLGQPIYKPAQGTSTSGCISDASCNEQLAGSTCIMNGEYQGLCDSGEKTFAGTPLNMTEAVRDHIILMHNYRRSRLAQGLVPNGNTGKKLPAGTDIAQMSYNMGLERAAQAYANNCPTGLSSVASRNGTGEIYQSLPSNTSTYMDAISTALKASWHAIYIVGFDDTLEFVQHLEAEPNAPIMFTQMAWGNTHEVGCGAARCSSNTTVICRYNPSGNINGQKLYTPGATCSNCANGCTTASDSKGLCII